MPTDRMLNARRTPVSSAMTNQTRARSGSGLLLPIILLTVFTFLSKVPPTSAAGSPTKCPKECECDSLPPGSDQNWSVYCHSGGINDTHFANILQKLPANLRSLSIISPPVVASAAPNRFRWNDNLNKFTQLRQLRLVRSGLPAMSRSIRLPALEQLDLSDNQIEHATMGNFGGMPKLMKLDLSGNQLSILPTGVFTFLQQLQSLSLANNNITELSTNLLRGLRTLRALHLDENKIPVQQINDLFADISQLEELYLNDCGLSSLADLSLHGVPYLTHLGLAANGLNAVPSQQLQQLDKLRVLDLSRNQIPEIGPCALCGNNISRLDLSHNLLGLAKQPFHPDAFRNLPLMELDLSFNHMNEFSSKWLGWAQATIKTFKMSGNFLRGFQAEITSTLPRLVNLHMAHNAIEGIPLVFPPEYYHLEVLNISDNQISVMPDNIPYLLPNLKEFDLSHNQFTSLSQVTFEYIEKLDRVYLHNNPWDCSCSVQLLQLHMKERYAMRHTLRYQEVKCAQPAIVRGQQLMVVSGLHDCAVLLGASFGITQTSELLLLMGVVLLAALAMAVLGLCCYCLRERQYKGSYVTREHSRTPLTMSHHHISCSSSSASEPLSTSPYPPPPPKVTAAYFGI